MDDASNGTSAEQHETLEETIARHEKYWTGQIESLNAGLRALPDVEKLMCGLYTQRQMCLEYYYNLLAMISRMSRDYKKNFQTQYNYYKVSSAIKYSTETAIASQISGDLADEKYKIECYENFAKFMADTLRTIDDIIYGVSNRIEIEKLVQSYK